MYGFKVIRLYHMNQAIIRMGRVRSAEIIYELLVVVPWFFFFHCKLLVLFRSMEGEIHSRE